MTSNIVFTAGFILTLIIVYLLGSNERKRQDKAAINQFHKQFGSAIRKNLSYDRIQSLSGYQRHMGRGTGIDDITFSDLSVLDLFNRIDRTQSASGEEYLFFLLNSYADKELISDEEISYYEKDENDGLRNALLLELRHLGSTGNYSLYDYLDKLNQLGNRSSTRHYMGILFYFISVMIMFFHAGLGSILFILTVILNIAAYYKEKREIDPYLICFRYLLRLLDSAEKASVLLQKEGVPKAAHISETIRDNLTVFKEMKRYSGLLVSGNGRGSFADIFIDYIRILFHIDLIIFNHMLNTVKSNPDKILVLSGAVGRVDAAISIASFRRSLPFYSKPLFDESAVPEIEDVYHPLLENPVCNSIHLNRPVLLTGSNASGKSTFLKAAAVCALLAQTILTCPAKSYIAPHFRIMTSMAIKDSLKNGDSYFMAEIKSMKRIVTASDEDGSPILCCIDEILRGTNTIERIAASTELLHDFAKRNILCIAATHDLELTELLPEYDLYHFAEEIHGDDICFSYRLLNGKADSRNAIRLMASLGFDRSITEKAAERASLFEKNGTWK